MLLLPQLLLLLPLLLLPQLLLLLPLLLLPQLLLLLPLLLPPLLLLLLLLQTCSCCPCCSAGIAVHPASASAWCRVIENGHVNGATIGEVSIIYNFYQHHRTISSTSAPRKHKIKGNPAVMSTAPPLYKFKESFLRKHRSTEKSASPFLARIQWHVKCHQSLSTLVHGTTSMPPSE